MFFTRLNRFLARQVPAKPVRLAPARAIASISFDDFPKSAWTVAGPLLARHGVRGTYYTAGVFCGRTMGGTEYYDEADLAALAAAGHEIGCHGFAHQPVSQVSPPVFADDAARNAEFLRPFLKGGAAKSYAFPFGAVSLRTKKFYAARFASARGVHPALNTGRTDLGQLNAIGIESRNWDAAAAARAILRARDDKSWIIFYTHDVSEAPGPYGATPAMLSFVLEKLTQAGIETLPVAEALVKARAV